MITRKCSNCTHLKLHACACPYIPSPHYCTVDDLSGLSPFAIGCVYGGVKLEDQKDIWVLSLNKCYE